MNLCEYACCWHGRGLLSCCRCGTEKSDGLLVMVSNQTGIEVGLLAGKYPGRIGHMFSPGGERGPWPELPSALDNDAWPAAKNDRPRNEAGHLKMLNWALLSGARFRFALVPDVVGDRDATLREWERWSPKMAQMGFRLGFAAQDGMTFGDVPDGECVVFLGGNGMPRLLAAHHAGAVSVDGTGWFHKGRTVTSSQTNELRKFLRETTRAA